MSQERPILDYASPQPMTAKFPTPIRLTVLLFILPALALPFVEHYFRCTPLHIAGKFFMDIMEIFKENFPGEIGLIIMAGLNFFVGIPLVLCHLRVRYRHQSFPCRWIGPGGKIFVRRGRNMAMFCSGSGKS